MASNTMPMVIAEFYGWLDYPRLLLLLEPRSFESVVDLQVSKTHLNVDRRRTLIPLYRQVDRYLSV